MKQMALSRSEVEILFSHNNRRAVRYRAAAGDSGLKQRLATIFGEDFAENCIRVELEWGDMRVSGWVSRPDYTRSQPDQQYLFVNGRGIRDRSIMHAVRQAYIDVLFDPSRYPVCALYLDIGADLVDVNVHPAKSEVRFRQQREVYRFVMRAVNGALSGKDLAAPTNLRRLPLPSPQHSTTIPTDSFHREKFLCHSAVGRTLQKIKLTAHNPRNARRI